MVKLNGLHFYFSNQWPLKAQYCLTFTCSCTHSHTDGRVSPLGRQPTCQKSGSGDRTSNLPVTSRMPPRIRQNTGGVFSEERRGESLGDLKDIISKPQLVIHFQCDVRLLLYSYVVDERLWGEAKQSAIKNKIRIPLLTQCSFIQCGLQCGLNGSD